MKLPSDGDNDSLESNPAYNDLAEFEHYTLQHIVNSHINDLECSIEDNPQVTVGSVDSTSSSVYYSKPELVSDPPEENSSVYYSQPFSSHLAPENIGDAMLVTQDIPPPLPKSRNGDGIVTITNVAYQRILSSESSL